MKSRWALKEEKSEIQVLWKLCFGDSKEYTDCFFSNFPPEEHTRVIEEDGKIKVMASWLPVILCSHDMEFPGAYLYAVATDPHSRRRGLCKSLMAELEKELWKMGMAFCALCPAEAALYKFYESMGYRTSFVGVQCDMEPQNGFTEITAEEYRILREQYLEFPYCRWDIPALLYLSGTGSHFYRGESCCLSIDSTGRILECPGMNCIDRVPCGMIKWQNTSIEIQEIHLGFAFD